MHFPNHSKERGIVYVPILVAVIGLLGFFFISSSTDFKSKLFANLFPDKPKSHAAEIVFPSPLLPKPYDSSEFYGANLPADVFPDPGSDTNMQKVRDDLTKAGVKWLRTDVSPKIYHSYCNHPPFASSCGPVNKLEGVQVIGVIDQVTVRDAHTLCSSYGLPQFYTGLERIFTLEQWGKVVECVATELKDKVNVFEIWNEPTVPAFQGGYQDGSPQHYFDMLKVAYEKIKAISPNAQVVALGGLAIHGADDVVEAEKNFSKKVVELGGANYADAIAVHGYGPDDYGGWLYDSYEKNLKFHKDLWKGKPVWVTETGHKVDAKGNQSEYLDRVFNELIGAGAEKIFWYSLREDRSAPGFGLVDATGNSRPVHDYYKQFINTPKSGLLRLTTEPAVEATITIIPTEKNSVIGPNDPMVRTWGISWERLQAGKYQMNFSYPHPTINGQKAQIPPDQIIEIQPKKTLVIQADLTKGTTSIEYFWE